MGGGLSKQDSAAAIKRGAESAPLDDNYICISDGNKKIITPSGEFIVNGKKHGDGVWITPTRFCAQVAAWGGVWWIGEMIPTGMNTMCVDTQELVLDATPVHLEPYTPDSRHAAAGGAAAGHLPPPTYKVRGTATTCSPL